MAMFRRTSLLSLKMVLIVVYSFVVLIVASAGATSILEESKLLRGSSKESIQHRDMWEGSPTGGSSDMLRQHHPDQSIRFLQVLDDTTNSTNATDGNILDTVGDELNEVLTTNPTSWTTAQQIGVAIGSAVAVLLLGGLCWCCSYYCRKRRAQDENARSTYQMRRPYFQRSGKSVAPVNALDPSTLPLGVRLHGALQLRGANLEGQAVRVAVIDSGIDKDHPGFHNMVKRQVWFRKGTPLEQDDHGTHVAGTIHLLAPQAELYDYRVFGERGDLNGDYAIAASIREAVDVDGCHVINMSLRVSYPIVKAVREAVVYAYKKGVHMVCAAGNSGDGDPTTNEMYAYPARWKETISVAAVKKAGNLPVAFFSESNPEVDFAGVGVDVISLKPGGGYQGMQGTSMAAPHVTGLIAALLSKNGRKFSPATLKKKLASNYAIDIGAKGPDTSTGVGFATYLSSKEELEQLLASSKMSSSSSRRQRSGGVRAQAY